MSYSAEDLERRLAEHLSSEDRFSNDDGFKAKPHVPTLVEMLDTIISSTDKALAEFLEMRDFVKNNKIPKSIEDILTATYLTYYHQSRMR